MATGRAESGPRRAHERRGERKREQGREEKSLLQRVRKILCGQVESILFRNTFKFDGSLSAWPPFNVGRVIPPIISPRAPYFQL